MPRATLTLPPVGEQGIRYTIYHPPTKLSLDANGNGVVAAWGSQVVPGDDDETIKAKVEAEIQRISPETSWEWQPDGGLFTFQRVPGTRTSHACQLSASLAQD